MIKIVRASSGPLQTAFNRMAAFDALSAATVTVEFGSNWVKVMVTETPENISNADVLELFINAFRAEGWGYRAELDGPVTDLTSKLIGYTFNHPITQTRVGNFMPARRPAELGLVIPLPHRSVPLDTAAITKFAADASDLVVDLLTQQKVKEDAERPAPPVPLWARPQAELVEDTVETPAPASAPTHTQGLELDEDDDQ